MPHLSWIIIGLIVVIALLLVVAAVASARRRQGGTIRVTALPGSVVAPYETRLPELEKMFVNQPREAVAAAKLMVDDMLNRMGFPIRMSTEERVKDLRGHDRKLSDQYRSAAMLRDDPTTEQLRRSLQGYVVISRALLVRAERSTDPAVDPAEPAEPVEPNRPEVA